MRRGGGRRRALAAAALAVAAAVAVAGPARAELVTQDVRFTASDGVSLHATVGGEGPLEPRPLIVEFSPYAPGCCASYAGPAYNYVQVHVRGTGRSDGRFDIFGPRMQRDVAEFLAWACDQPWSDGRIGLYGASASAIAIYHALHLELPCVKTAVLWSGTHELYRDLLYPGGIPNLVPAAGVGALILAPYLASLPQRLERDPASMGQNALGVLDTVLGFLGHPALDDYWRQRRLRGDANDLPVLMVDGFFDVESRGAFQAFRELRDDGAHLLVIGAHDGVPAGTGGEAATRARWFDRWLRGIENGVEDEPRVRLWLADGSREDLLAGRFVRLDGDDWPLPGTEWEPLALTPDGGLALDAPAREGRRTYPAVPSLPTATDPHTTSILLGFAPQLGELARDLGLTDMRPAEHAGLRFTSAPLGEDVVMAGPGSAELVVASTTPESDLFVVVSDVAPDGVAHPVAAGRLRTSFPAIDRSRSLVDDDGDVVQPYGRFDVRRPARPGEERRYHVELWPIGNRFRRGHRIRIHLVGASAYHLPGPPALHTVRLGGEGGSRVLLPVAPGSDLRAALGAR